MLGQLITTDIHKFIPHLKFSKKATINNKRIGLFKLDWDTIDTYKQHSYITWRSKLLELNPTDITSTPDTLPPEYDKLIKDLIFAITDKYKTAINHFTKLYYKERHRKWSFDTVIADKCRQPGTAAINTAFQLLADCCYDPNTNDWLRKSKIPHINKHIISCLLQYKFWASQTGSSIVWRNADLDKIEEIANMMSKGGISSGDIAAATEYRNFLSTIKKWELEQRHHFEMPEINTQQKTQPLGSIERLC